jgi:hypothetical protein
MFLDTKSLISLAHAEFDANDARPRVTPGAWGIYHDAIGGMRVLKYVKNVDTSALVLGDVAVKVADVAFTQGVLNTATRITKSGWNQTANAHVGKRIIVEGNDTSAGAAPEGETGLIVKNSATVIDIDGRLPFSVSSVADIDCRVQTPGWHSILGGAAALARDVDGIVVGVNGISVGYYGWVQFEGYCPQAKFTAAAVTALANVVTAASGALITVGVNTMEKVVGYAPGTIESTHPGKMPVVMTLLSARDVV